MQPEGKRNEENLLSQSGSKRPQGNYGKQFNAKKLKMYIGIKTTEQANEGISLQLFPGNDGVPPAGMWRPVKGLSAGGGGGGAGPHS
jgi:hypothetical protein